MVRPIPLVDEVSPSYAPDAPGCSSLNVTARLLSPINIVLLISCVLTTVIALTNAWEGVWSPISGLMTSPRSVPIYGHRLLFVAVAWLCKLWIPTLTYRKAWWLSQVVATVFTFLTMALWTRNQNGAAKVGVGSLLLTVMLIPTIGYCTFYDIAIVGFYSLCLLLLAQNRLVSYLAVYTVAFANHENILLLLPVVVLYLWSRRRWVAGASMGAAQVVIYLTYRLAVHHFLPTDSAFQWNLGRNLHIDFEWRQLALAAMALFLSFAGTAIGFRCSPRIIKIGVIALVPALLLVTLLFGQINEPRQFDAIIALAVPSILCALGQEDPSHREKAAMTATSH